jgi:hypothetical protein
MTYESMNNFEKRRLIQQMQMDNIIVRPNRDERRQLKPTVVMQKDHYTQIDCLPGPCVRMG